MNSRLISLDFFRGLTIAAMIVVNDPGSWSYVYPPLRHADWHGVTPTDLVFPFFLFIVGVSIVLALSKRNKTDTSIYFKIIKRTIIIFSIGLFLALFPNFDFENLRIAGVLQRIALVYLFCSVIYLNSSFLVQVWIGVVLLLLYWVFMTKIPFDNVLAGTLEPGNNFAAWVDQFITPGRMYQKTWDPEGFFSTIPAIATGLSGMFCGHILLNKSKDLRDKIILIFVVMIGGIYLGWFTPTEGGAIGAGGTGLIAVLNKNFKFSDLIEVIENTAVTSAMIFLVLLGAEFFNSFIALTQLPNELGNIALNNNLSPLLIVACILILYLFLGCLMDSLAMILLTIPVFFPLIMTLDFGMTPEETAIWFGILTLIVVEVGLITPPVGLNVFIINKLAGDVSISETFKGVLPFLISDIFRVILLFSFPGITLFLLRIF